MATGGGCVSSARNKYFCLLLLLIVSEVSVSMAALPIPGIHLGTTHACTGLYRDGVEIIANEQGNRITPSWVAFTDAEPFVGEAAKNQSVLYPNCTLFYVHRSLGRKFGDPQVHRDIKSLPFKVVNEDGNPYINVKLQNGKMKMMSPEEISAMVLKKLKQTAESYLGKEIKEVVITVPDRFTDLQTYAIKDAGSIAGLKVHTLARSIAAAKAYFFQKPNDTRDFILVFRLGGNSFDVSVLGAGSVKAKVWSTVGNSHLGGENFDQNLVAYFVKLVKNKYNKDISKDKNALWKLRKECERAKMALSIQDQVHVEIEPFLDGIKLYEPLSRWMFEQLNVNLFRKMLKHVKQALKYSGLKKENIDEIVLAGGSTRIPKVQQLLKDFFNGKEPHKSINPEEAIAHGAAIQGAILSGDYHVPHNRDIMDFIMGEVLGGSYEVETLGGAMTMLIPNRSLPPLKRTHVFTTCQDWQTTVSINVYECLHEEYPFIGCHRLGKVDLSGISPARGGLPQIEVTFDVGYDGLPTVTAVDMLAKSNNATISITSFKEKKKDEQELNYYPCVI